MKRILLVVATIIILAPFALALDETVRISLTPPTHFATAGDCNSLSRELTPSDLAALMYRVKYSVNGGPETDLSSATGSLTLNIPAGSTLVVTHGAFLPGGTVTCWSDPETFVVPVPPVGKCGKAIIQLE